LVLGKLGDLLNKDVGSIVKDAGKVLNADVGDIVKGAGKVLSTDVKDLVRDKPADAGDTQDAAKRAAEARAAAIAAAAGKPVATTSIPARPAQLTAAQSEADALAGDKTMALPRFDPDATLQLNTPPLAGYEPPQPAPPPATEAPRSAASVLAPPPAAPIAGVAANASAAVPILNDETTQRHRRGMPSGTQLAQLLPHAVGDFTRPQSMPSGEIASDTVSANYGAGGETVVVKLALCWDADEAREPLERLVREAGDRVRLAPDRSWVLAETAQGVAFAWTRDAYSFSATSAKGLGALTRFLWAFPY
jgi:hypothetical protein